MTLFPEIFFCLDVKSRQYRVLFLYLLFFFFSAVTAGAVEGIPTAISTPVNDVDPWISDGETLNIYPNQFVYVVSTRHAQSPVIASGKNGMFAVWGELNFNGIPQVYVKKRKAGSWVQVGKSLNINDTSKSVAPDIAIDGVIPYVSWIEEDKYKKAQVYVKVWSGKWTSIGGSLNQNINKNAYTASIAIFRGAPVVTWVEESDSTPVLRVKSWNGQEWVSVGKPLSSDAYPIDPVIESNGEKIYVAWSEVSSSGAIRTYLVRGIGQNWEIVGDALNNNLERHAMSPSIAFDRDVPVVAWSETDSNNLIKVYVKKFNGTAWEQMGGALNEDPDKHASSPSAVFYKGRLLVGFSEKNSLNHSVVYVKFYHKGQWIAVGQMLNIDKNAIAVSPSLAAGDKLYTAWIESSINGVFQVYVKQFDNMTHEKTLRVP